MSNTTEHKTDVKNALFMDTDIITLACAFSAFENVEDSIAAKYITTDKFNFTDTEGNVISKTEVMVLSSGYNEVYFVFEREDPEKPILQVLTVVLDQDATTGQARQKIFDIRALTDEQYWLFVNIAGKSLIDRVFKISDSKEESTDTLQ